MLFGPPASSLAHSPFHCRYLSTWARSLFHLLGAVPVRPGDLLHPVVSVGFLGGCPFFGTCVTALVVIGRHFLLCFPLFGFLFGRVALAGSRGRVAVGVVINFGLLGGNLSAGALATSLLGRSVVVAHAHELGECSGGFETEHHLGF